jgi:hypothetical protein
VRSVLSHLNDDMEAEVSFLNLPEDVLWTVVEKIDNSLDSLILLSLASCSLHNMILNPKDPVSKQYSAYWERKWNHVRQTCDAPSEFLCAYCASTLTDYTSIYEFVLSHSLRSDFNCSELRKTQSSFLMLIFTV